MADSFQQDSFQPDSFTPDKTPPSTVQQPEGGAVGRFLKGAWDTLNPLPALRMVVDLAQTGANPGRLISPETQQALKGIIDSHVDQAQKAKTAWEQGNHVEAAGHLLGAVVPLVGPAAAAAGEQMGGSPPQFDKYGNVVKPGQAPDIAGGAGRGAGLIAGVAAPEIARAAGGATETAADATAAALERSAQTQYSRVLNATTKGNKIRSAEIVPELIERGYAGMTLKGLQAKAAAKISSVGHAIGDAWDSLPEGTAVKLDDVLNGMDRNASDLTVTVGSKAVPKGPIAEQGLSNLERLKDTLRSMAEPDPQTGEMQIPVDRLRSVRQYFDNVSKLAGRFEGKTLSDASMAEAHSMAADAIRAQLNDFPGIEALNKEYAFWKDVNQVVSDTMLRRQGQAKPLSAKLTKAATTAAGFGTGGVHGAIVGRAAGEALEQVATSPAWQTVSAVLKDRLAKAIAEGNRGAAEFYISKIVGAAKVAAPVNALSQQSGPLALPAGQ